ncbi:MAG TPA: rhodanese-like domain-containing protein [Kofleriaceae bacterium]|nr:rhodanese-like domain-containing protein [Kofleriaceae bacterium]
MRKLVLVAMVISASIAVSGAGCSKARDEAAANKAAKIAPVSVDQLDHMLAKNDCVAVDANENMTRQRMGVIPGAVILRDGDLADQLPRDKAEHLVFYCANEACRASEEAAEQAVIAGYTHVQVMPAGIAGWVRAGKKTSSL